jgi:predicted dehydrogenase
MSPTGAESAIARWSDGFGADLVVVAATARGSEPMVTAAEVARERGRIVAVGATGLDLPRRTLYQKELSLVVSRSYGPGRYDPDYEERGRDYPRAYVRWTERDNMRTFLELVADGRVDVRPLVTHRYDIEHGADAYAMLESSETLGILLEYPTTSRVVAGASTPVSIRPRQPLQDRPRISVIGAGAFAHSVLLPALTRANASLGEVVAATGLSARSAADRFGFDSCSTSADSVWRDRSCDAVVIATRHDSHARLVIEALTAGKPVFVEKPLCITESELVSILHAVDSLRAAGQTPFVMAGFNRRFAPSVDAVRVAMAGAPLSIVYRINAGRVASDSWIARTDEGGGRVVGEVCHFVDLCTHLSGSPVVEVFATRSAAGPDDVMASLRMANGSIGTVAYLIDGDRAAPKERIEVFGGGRVATIDDFRRTRVSGTGRTVRHGGVFASQDKGHAAEMLALVRAVASGAPSPTSFESIVNTTRTTFAIVRSLESGTSVRVS